MAKLEYRTVHVSTTELTKDQEDALVAAFEAVLCPLADAELETTGDEEKEASIERYMKTGGGASFRYEGGAPFVEAALRVPVAVNVETAAVVDAALAPVEP